MLEVLDGGPRTTFRHAAGSSDGFYRRKALTGLVVMPVCEEPKHAALGRWEVDTGQHLRHPFHGTDTHDALLLQLHSSVPIAGEQVSQGVRVQYPELVLGQAPISGVPFIGLV